MAETLGQPSTGPRRIADLDGPRGWPFVGNLFQLDLSRMHQQLEDWVWVHGPLYRLRLGHREALVIARPDLLKAILRDRPDGWRRFELTQAVLNEMGIDGVFSAEGESWRRQRRLVAAAFTPGQLKRYFPLIARVTIRLQEQLGIAADANSWVDVQKMLMRYTVDVLASLAFGVDVNTLEHPKDALQEHLDKVLPMVMLRQNALFPIWRYVKSPADRVFDHHLASGHAAVVGFIQAARDRMSSDPSLSDNPTNLLEAMLAARDANGHALSDAELVGNTFTTLLAGEDTTANTLAWSLYLLHTNPEVLSTVSAEVAAALADDTVPSGIETLTNMPMVDACLNESMRLRPVAPLHYLQNNAPVVVDGVKLPAGTLVLGVTRSGAMDLDVAPDAGAFRPSRWLERPHSGTEHRDVIDASIPFGAGPRVCPGRYLATLEMQDGHIDYLTQL